MEPPERDLGDDSVAPHDTVVSAEPAPAPRRRTWWPALIGVGLAVAAVVGVIVWRADDAAAPTAAPAPEPTETSAANPATSTQPTTSAPASTTTDVPSADVSVVVQDGCLTVTTIDGTATGCPHDGPDVDQLPERRFVADLGGPVVVTTGGRPIGATAERDDATMLAPCRWDELAPLVPVGGLLELVVCNDSGVMVATTGPSAGAAWSLTHLTLPTPFLPTGGDLGPGRPVPGMPGALAFTAPVQDIVNCSLLLVPDRTRWMEACGDIHGLELATALVQVGAALYELSIDESGSIESARALDAMPPSSGCSLDSANALVTAVHETQPSAVVMGLGCIEDKAALTTGSVLTQAGGPDGSIWLALRVGGVWDITDNGTGIETLLSFPIVPVETWSSWPESTLPTYREYWWAPIISLPVQPDIASAADVVLATLATLDVEPEFPLNERLVAVEPAGLPLIVAQVDLGGDDSVSGAVIHVWLSETFDDTGSVGWRPTAVLTGDVCARGATDDNELCL